MRSFIATATTVIAISLATAPVLAAQFADAGSATKVSDKTPGWADLAIHVSEDGSVSVQSFLAGVGVETRRTVTHEARVAAMANPEGLRQLLNKAKANPAGPFDPTLDDPDIGDFELDRPKTTA